MDIIALISGLILGLILGMALMRILGLFEEKHMRKSVIK